MVAKFFRKDILVRQELNFGVINLTQNKKGRL